MEQNQIVQVQKNSGNYLVRQLGIIVSVLVFLLPIFFIPGSLVGLHIAKITLLATGLVAMLVIFLSSVIYNGVIEIPKVKYLIPIGVFALVALISSIFTGAISSSIAGDVFDLGSSGSILILVFSLFVTLLAVKSQNVVNKTILAFVYSNIVLVLYTLVATLGSSILPVSLTSKLPIFLAGGLVDTAIILGGAVIFALCMINMSEVSKHLKYALSVLIALAILFIGASGFQPAIITLGIIALVFFVYVLSWSFNGEKSESNSLESSQNGQDGGNRKISFSALIVLIAMVLLVLGGSTISGYLSRLMSLQYPEIRPDFQSTMNLAMASWKQNFAFGVGPNRFLEFWSLHKPTEIIQTQFWNTDFYSGSGFVPTIAVTTGLFGFISLLAFVGMYLLTGLRAVFAQANSGRSRYLSLASFLVSFYLWIMLFLYSPPITVLALAFIFTGLFTTTLVPQGVVSVWKINIFANPKTNFVSVLLIVVLLILSVSGGYFVWERSIAAVLFQNGIQQYQLGGDTNASKELILKSTNLVSRDVYWRGLSEILVADLNKTLGSVTDKSQLTDSIKAQIQGLIGSVVESSKRAVEADRGNFKNWFSLGRVYEILAQNGVEGSLDSAKVAYNEAALRSVNNPAIPLALARLDLLVGKVDDARVNITKSLELKNNYTDAYYTLAQIEASTNNIPAAIRSVEAITVIEPNNPGLYFQLGLLRYNQKDFAGTVSAFERAIVLAPDYANAKYFLGLAYYQTNKKAEALKQFEELKTSNPDNQEISLILANLKAGKPLFTDAKPPVDNKPEKRSSLPVKE